jgi:hypothetical protein
MAGFSLKDICVTTGNEEDLLKGLIAEAWNTMRTINWDTRSYCVFRPAVKAPYPIAKNFQTFYEGEGWHVVIHDQTGDQHFTIYSPEKVAHM